MMLGPRFGGDVSATSCAAPSAAVRRRFFSCIVNPQHHQHHHLVDNAKQIKTEMSYEISKLAFHGAIIIMSPCHATSLSWFLTLDDFLFMDS